MSNRTRKLRTEQLERREMLAADAGAAAHSNFDLEYLIDLLVIEVAAIDGSGNNLIETDWGSTDEQLLRLVSVEYGDGISTPAGEVRPSAREVSNVVADQTKLVSNDRGLTDLVWLWGQFIDHDIDLTEGADPAEAFNIEVPAGDAYFDPDGTGTEVIGLNRSVYDTDTGDELGDPRQQLNQISAFLDGSVIYGSDEERAAALRTFEGGKLKTSAGDLLPFNEGGLDNAGGPFDTLFLAGDVRANENAALTAMQTLWVREHNRLAEDIAAENPDLTDEEIYQQARAIVRAELQVITYNEFLPALLGKDALSEYTGYDPTVNPGISNLFSTAAYRLGHSMLPTELLRLNNDGSTVEAGNLALQDAFFAPQEIIEGGIDSLLLGAANQQAQEIDNMIIDDVRNFLFGDPGDGGFDLASLNIQRGRDHGLADYNQARIDLGLEPVTSFAEITSDPQLAAELEALYGDINNIDAWVGGLAEDHLPGSSLGEFMQTVLVDQFERLRDGDRFWYENVLSERQIAAVERATLSDVIMRNTDIEGLSDNVFVEGQDERPDRPDRPHRDHRRMFNPRLADRGRMRPDQPLSPMDRQQIDRQDDRLPSRSQPLQQPPRTPRAEHLANRPLQPAPAEQVEDLSEPDTPLNVAGIDAGVDTDALDLALGRMRFGRSR